MPARIHIFDPPFGVSDGHYLNYNTVIVRELEARGFEVAIYTAKTWRAEKTPDFPVHPLFTWDLFTRDLNADAQAWPLDQFQFFNDAFHDDLRSIEQAEFTKDDIAFFVNITHEQLDGVRRWVIDLPEERRPTIVVRLSYLAHRMPHLLGHANKDLTALLLRYALRELLAQHERTAVCTDSEEIAAELRIITGVDASLLPLPLPVDDAPPAGERPNGLRCAYLGHASAAKGVGFLPEIIGRVAQTHQLEYIIQLPDKDGAFQAIEQRLDNLAPGVATIFRSSLTRSEYIAALQQADIVLLPYGREYYGWATSGIFCEATSLGKVTVAPAATWMANQARKHQTGCQTFGAWNAAEIAHSLVRAIQSFPELSRKATAAAPAWKSRHSAAGYVDALLAVTGKPSQAA